MDRVYTLIIYRMITLSIFLIYELTGIALGLPIIEFHGVIWVSLIYGMLNWLNVLMSERFESFFSSGPYLFFSFTVDVVTLSTVVFIAGWNSFGPKIGYVIIIVVSSIFLDKIYIYVLALMSVSFYLFVIQLSKIVFSSVHEIENVPTDWAGAVSGQLVAVFSTALISAFIQKTYRKTRQALVDKERSIGFLRETRRRIVESLPSGLLTVALDGRINYVNPVGEKLLQQDAVTLWGQNLFEMFDLPRNLQLARDLGKALRFERRVRVEGSYRDFGITLSSFQFETGEEGLLVLFQDLTKIKTLEAQKKLEDRMAAFGKMAAGVAHEIRNPLAAMSGSIQVLKELIPEDETAQELAGIIQKESSRLNGIISQFLAYARPGSPSKMEPVRLDKILTNFVLLVKNDPSYALIAIKLEIETESKMIGDEGKLLQVFWNLVKNSYKACQGEGDLVIRLWEEAEQICLRFSDFGIGMTEEEMRELFTPFQSFSRGTGLGMSIVYDIIQMHRGQIEVRSEPGKGTDVDLKFSIYRE